MELTEQEYEMLKQLLQNYGQTPLKLVRREKGTGSVVNLGKGRRKPYDETVVSKIMGHSRGHVTEDVYTHISIEDMLSEVSKLPSRF